MMQLRITGPDGTLIEAGHPRVARVGVDRFLVLAGPYKIEVSGVDGLGRDFARKIEADCEVIVPEDVA